MKATPFEYVLARSLTEATDALGETEDAVVLAGGQSLVPLMNLRLAQPSVVVDINGISDLNKVERLNGTVRLGSMCRQRRLETDPRITELAPLVSEAVVHVGHVQIRNRGTLGGSLAHADPLSELPAVLVALEGEVEATSTTGSRVIAARDFYVGTFATTLEPGELLTSVSLPVPGVRDGFAWDEFSLRYGDFAVAGIAAVVSLDESGSCTHARLVGAGLGATPVDLSGSADPLVGLGELSDEVLLTVADGVAEEVDPTGDIHGSVEYRRELAQLLAVRTLRTAWKRAGGVDR
jgi:CO/xanthine dehydrogenase FAD-binding subunit